MNELDEFYNEMDNKKGKLPPFSEGVVREVLVRTAGELFGDHVRPYENESLEDAKKRKFIQVIIATEFGFDVRAALSPSRNPQSKMGKFVNMYGERPRSGMKVKLLQEKGKDGRDYYKIAGL